MGSIRGAAYPYSTHPICSIHSRQPDSPGSPDLIPCGYLPICNYDFRKLPKTHWEAIICVYIQAPWYFVLDEAKASVPARRVSQTWPVSAYKMQQLGCFPRFNGTSNASAWNIELKYEEISQCWLQRLAVYLFKLWPAIFF